MITHSLIQGSNEWHQFRLEHFGASEAAAMLGLSKKVKRNELLHMKKTGTAKEFSEWVQKNILDHGHEVEALARPIIEANIGEDLYPVTCSEGILSASCDGLTASDSTGWEHKQWNAALAAAVVAKELPDEYMVQPQQCLMVTKAERWIFTVSDGTDENMVSMEILPDPAWFERIRAGWVQFDIDFEEYVPAEVVPTPVAAPIKDLPAIIYRLDGLALTSNLAEYKSAALKLVEDSKAPLTTDQDFADRDALCKKFKKAEEGIAILQGQVVGEIQDVDAFCRGLGEIGELIRQARLNGEKKVAAEKENRRNDILAGVKAKWTAHIESLNARIGKAYMPEVATNFPFVMKGLKSLTSMNDAVDTELARAKIEANAIADKIQLNLTTLRELAASHAFLFADFAQIVLKAPEDCSALIRLRIAEHKEAEDKRLVAERARIAEEERIKAEAKARTEQAELQRQQSEIAEAKRKQEVEVAAKHAAEEAEADKVKHFAGEPKTQAEIIAAFADCVKPELGAVTEQTPPTLRLGQIGERLGFALTADFLTSLGFPPAATDKNAKLYHESSFPRICAALIAHIAKAQELQAA